MNRSAAPASPPVLRDTRGRPQLRRRRLAATLGSALLAAMLLAGAVYGYRAWRSAAPSAIPTFRVEPGTVQVAAYAQGTLQGGEADRLMAPSIGDDLPRISFLLPAGSEVKPGDVVVRFNTGQEEFKLAQAQNALAQAQANIAAAEAQVRAQALQDAYSLQHAQYAVQLAQIQVERNPLLTALDAHQNDLSLAAAQSELKQWQHDIAQQQANGKNLVATQQQAAAKARQQAADARQHIASMTLRAARAGYVAVEPNRRGNVLYQGAMLPPLQVGDQVSPGSLVAQIPDLGTIQMQAHLAEAGSAYVAVGQTAQVRVEGMAGRAFAARVLRVAGLGDSSDFFSSSRQQASCVLTLSGGDAALRPGMDARATIVLSEMHNVLWVPAEALFQRDGKPVVFVLRAGRYLPQPVKVLRQGPTRIAIAGVAAGASVALTDPTAAPEAQP
ncbi:MAG TPA: HlyD family efflux transporter periplasmic adaptor subunit [Terriglobales bacterium]|nr:HlyD family efflux transporter periplasmic adaptor subunit [Terriglobales bacterium]